MTSIYDEKFRHELKYVCSGAELAILKSRLQVLLKSDPHTGPGGSYLIRSLYFDDYEDSCLRDNEDGVSPRKKWRIRCYDCSDKVISLEVKYKAYDMICKKSCRLDRGQLERITEGALKLSGDQPALLREFLTEQSTRGLRPVIIVQYKRYPYICREGNVRVTLDCNIASASPKESLFEENISKRPILPTGRQLLEVKYDTFLPDYVFHCSQMLNMRRSTFSKYYLCRKYQASYR